jgi:fido (protein-threonine AMPylation protein)
MLERRPEASPGEFKEDTNFAGQTKFVEPAYLRGTLLEAVKMAISVPEGLARAIFYAFLVSEIHPFNDGNGRLSRLLMNAELSRLGRARIIIPTLYHEQYVDAQRALSRRNDPEPLIRALSRIAEWATLFDYTDVHSVIIEIKKTNAFEEDLREFRLLRPNGNTFA